MRDLIVKQNQFENENVSDMLTELEIRRPKEEEFFRVVGGEEYSKESFAMHEAQSEGGAGNFRSEIYVVSPNMLEEMSGFYCPTKFVLAVNRDDKFFIMPIKLLNKNGGTISSAKSALQAEEKAKKQWIRIFWRCNKYERVDSEKDFPVPSIPPQSFCKLLQIALQERVIDSPDHIIAKKIRGSI